MRVVALDALEVRPWSEGVVPITAQPAMHTDLPISVGHAVALSAEQCRLIAREFTSAMAYVSVAVPWVVAVKAVLIQAVREYDIGVLIRERVDFRIVPVAIVTHGALVGLAVTMKAQGTVHSTHGSGIEKA